MEIEGREAVEASAEQLKSLREKRCETIEILARLSLAGLSGTCYRGRVYRRTDIDLSIAEV